jgi:hypothetical protein
MMRDLGKVTSETRFPPAPFGPDNSVDPSGARPT